MNTKKAPRFLGIILATSILLTSCLQSGPANNMNNPGSNESQSSVSTLTANQEIENFITQKSDNPDKIIFKYATTERDMHSNANTRAQREFLRVLKEELGDKIEIEIYVNGSLGGGTTDSVVGGIQTGSISGAPWGCANYAELTNAFMPFDLPYFFDSMQGVYDMIRGDVGNIMKLKCAEETGVYPIAITVMGMRHMTNSKRPIHVPSDLNGLKIRIQNNNIHIRMIENYGASASTMAFSELFTGLQQKVVDGQENPSTNIDSNNYGEVQNYMTLTGHLAQSVTIAINYEWFNQQSDEVRQAFLKAADIAEENALEECLSSEEEILERLSASMEIYTPTDEEMEQWKTIGQQVWPEAGVIMGVDYFNRIMEASGRDFRL